jgi:hypothetical protein
MLFKRKRKPNDHPIKDKAARGIARFLLTMQTKFSEFMNARMKNIPVKKIKILLVLFCMLGGGYSVYLFAAAILGSEKEQQRLKIEHVNVPKYYDQGGDDEFKTEHYVDEEIFQQIQSFEKFMDSLRHSESGRKIHDSILLARPGLADSIQMLKEIYQSQIK